MRAGSHFELTEHLVHDRDPASERHFLLLSVEHEGSNAYLSGQESTYENRFTCIRNTIAYRPPLLTPRPTMAGPLTATVVGPPDTEVFTDEMGRILVHYAGNDHDVIAQDQLALTSGAGLRLQAGQGISAFAQDAGISAIANRGQVLVQAQENDVVVNAQHNVHVSASEGEVLINAPIIRLVADDGSYLRLGGGGVEIGTAGKAIVHAATHDWLDAKNDSASVPTFTRDPADQKVGFHYPGHSEKAPRTAADQPFQLQTADGGVLAGIADALGHSSSVARESMQRLDVSALKKPKAP
jgi:uncharacterized protein (DUF2345 family)